MTRQRAFKRSDRIAELLHREIGGIIRLELRDPRLDEVTVTAVRCTDDLREAQVFVSVLSEDKAPALAALERSAGFIRAAIGRRCYLRYVPGLHFRLDTSLQNAARIEGVLDQLRREREEREAAQPEGEPSREEP